MFYLRKKFAEQFADFTGTDMIHIGDTGAFYFGDISAEDVKLFLLTHFRMFSLQWIKTFSQMI